MAIKKTIILSITSMILSCCASTNTYNAALKSWIGSSESELMKSWGEPIKSYSQGNSKYLIYNKIGPSTAFMGYQKAVVDISDCTTTFELVDNTIISSEFEGRNCRAR
jgi:hypothetical protein